MGLNFSDNILLHVRVRSYIVRVERVFWNHTLIRVKSWRTRPTLTLPTRPTYVPAPVSAHSMRKKCGVRGRSLSFLVFFSSFFFILFYFLFIIIIIIFLLVVLLLLLLLLLSSHFLTVASAASCFFPSFPSVYVRRGALVWAVLCRRLHV